MLWLNGQVVSWSRRGARGEGSRVKIAAGAAAAGEAQPADSVTRNSDVSVYGLVLNLGFVFFAVAVLLPGACFRATCCSPFCGLLKLATLKPRVLHVPLTITNSIIPTAATIAAAAVDFFLERREGATNCAMLHPFANMRQLALHNGRKVRSLA